MFGDPHGMFYAGVTADDAENYEYGSRSQSTKDRDYYHTSISFTKLVSKTEKSYLIEISGRNTWIPKKICRYEDFERCTMMVHSNTFSNIIARG